MPVAAWVWFAVAVVLGVAEVATLTLAFAMVSTACALAGVSAVLGAPPLAQVGVAAVVGAGGLLVVRPVVRAHLGPASGVRTGVAALTGEPAVTTVPVSPNGGQVRINGVLWRARLAYPVVGAPPLPVGTEVVVASVDGATLVVYPSESS